MVLIGLLLLHHPFLCDLTPLSAPSLSPPARGGTSFRFSTFFSNPAPLSPHFPLPAPPPPILHQEILYSQRLLLRLRLLLPDLNGLIISSFPVKRKKGGKSENISAELDKVWVERFFADQALHANEMRSTTIVTMLATCWKQFGLICMEQGWPSTGGRVWEEKKSEKKTENRKQFGRIGRVGLVWVGEGRKAGEANC